MSAPGPSVESLVVGALPGEDRELLQCGAVLRYITRPLAEVVTGSPEAAERLVEHPMVRGGGQGRADELWTIAEPLRKELLRGWAAADGVRALVAGDESAGIEACYARLACSAESIRAEGLAGLDEDVTRALAGGDVPRAHDLMRLLDEWPVSDAPDARELRDRLAPRLRRYTRALRDREATNTYLERGFDEPVRAMLLAADGPWMLHLHGPGGRGKTMFVKNLLGRRCPERDIPVARIDFDHVTQLGLATTEPWRLLLSIAEQLDPQLPGSPFEHMLASYGTVANVTQPEALPRVPPVSVAGAGPRGDEVAVEAGAEVPAKFRSRLARAVGAGHVVIALDTVENVLHADGADLAPVLAAFAELFHGGDGPDGARVPGLRLVISGRYDVTGKRPAGDGEDRVPGVREKWFGVGEPRWLNGTRVDAGSEMATLEVPGFSRAEALRFLTGPGGVSDTIARAVVRRTHDNPMKLALLAEYLADNPDVTAETIGSFERIDLFYLVDRVVDRIADGRVQWLLRWGALLPVLSREAAERVVWPALVAFAETGGDYDDTGADRLPPPRAGIRRWPRPRPSEVREPGAFERAWATLLDYTAHASWVYRADGLPDAVAFHTEVREPLRRLLRQGGHPAYDDIHRRSFEYWSGVAGPAQGATLTAAARALLFHAYQPWEGADHDGDRIFHDLLERAVRLRDERVALAREVLEIAAGPSAEVRSLAHLELAEAAVDLANRHGAAVAEADLSKHLRLIGAGVRAREPRRVLFLRAVLADASGRSDEAWRTLDGALDAPAPTGQESVHRSLVADWVNGRTPSPGGLSAARRLLGEAGGALAPAATAVVRGLLSAERWTEALDAVRGTESGELRAATRIALGDADAVLNDAASPAIWRARACLLRYEPARALRELGSGSPAEPLVAGEAYALLGEESLATGRLSVAASSPDEDVAVEAALAIARYQARIGHLEASSSYLYRLRTFADRLVVLRAAALEARLRRSERLLADAEAAAEAVPVLPPSARVELAVAALAVHGVAESTLAGLAEALDAVQGAGPRLLALSGLVEVADPPRRDLPPAGRRLLELTRLHLRNGPVALQFAQAELARVLGDRDRSFLLLADAAAHDDPDGAINRAVDEAIARAEGADRPAGGAGEDGESPDAVLIRISTGARDGDLEIVRQGTGPHTTTVIPAAALADGPYQLARAGAALLDLLGSALVPAGAAGRPARGGPWSLHLADADAARWPWEAGAIPSPAGVTRRQSGLLAPAGDPVVASPGVLVAVLRPERSRGPVADRLAGLYHERATVHARPFPGQPVPVDCRIVHLVADAVQRRRLPALRVGDGDIITAESLAVALGPGPLLLILDLTLSGSDFDAAEQLMAANAFAWHLVRSTPQVDVICASLGTGERRARLIEDLHAGNPLAGIAADLQRARPGWRDAVAVSTDQPARRYLLGGTR